MHCHLIISVPGLEKILVRLEKILFKLFRKYQWIHFLLHVRWKSSLMTYAESLFDNWKTSFSPLLIFGWRTFSRRVTVRWWWRHQQKIKCRPIRTWEIGGVLLSDMYVKQDRMRLGHRSFLNWHHVKLKLFSFLKFYCHVTGTCFAFWRFNCHVIEIFFTKL